jgi:hypothetical protein
MNKEEVAEALKRALDAFIESDKHLLAADASERSMSHQIAVHLAREIPGYDVDCEYNRDGFNVKRLQLGHRQVSDNDEEAVTVFPDIIVHRRGNNDHNLLVIEMKKAAVTGGFDYDYGKLRAFRAQLRYHWAAHLVIGNDHRGEFQCNVEWIDG